MSYCGLENIVQCGGVDEPCLSLACDFSCVAGDRKRHLVDRSTDRAVAESAVRRTEEPLMVKSAAPAAFSPDLCCKKERQLLRTM